MESARADRPAYSFSAKRNCSLAPRAAILVFAVTSMVTLGIGIAFAVLGAWPILPFAGAEVLALGCALFVTRRHARDCERIVLRGTCLRVAIREAERWTSYEFNAAWVRVTDDGEGGFVRLNSRGREVAVGRHLDTAGRRRLGRELRQRLAALR